MQLVSCHQFPRWVSLSLSRQGQIKKVRLLVYFVPSERWKLRTMSFTYSNVEYVDVLLLSGFCKGSASTTAQDYKDTPNRKYPSAWVFTKFFNIFVTEDLSLQSKQQWGEHGNVRQFLDAVKPANTCLHVIHKSILLNYIKHVTKMISYLKYIPSSLLLSVLNISLSHSCLDLDNLQTRQLPCMILKIHLVPSNYKKVYVYRFSTWNHIFFNLSKYMPRLVGHPVHIHTSTCDECCHIRCAFLVKYI